MRVCIVLLCTLFVACSSTPEHADDRSTDARFVALVDTIDLLAPAFQPSPTDPGATDRAALRAALDSFEREALSPPDRLNYDLIDYSINRAEMRARFPLHNFPVNAEDGAHLLFVRQLVDKHPINNVDDALAYIEQVKTAPAVSARVAAALLERRKAGIIAPRFTLQRSITQIDRLTQARPMNPRATIDHPLWADFNAKLEALNLPAEQSESLRGNLRIELSTRYRKAMLDLQRALYRNAGFAEEMGAWNIPDGSDWYHALLADAAADGLTPDNLHYLAKLEVTRLHGDIEKVIAQLGYNMGRRQFFRYALKTPRFYYSDDAVGQQRAISDANAVIDDVFPHLETLFMTVPLSMLSVTATSDPEQPGSFYIPAAREGAAQASYVINTGNPEAIPVWQLAAATFGETWPGRHLQRATVREYARVAAFRHDLSIPAYHEGWRLYAEYLPLEAGLYGDPWNNYGRLVRELYATVSVVLDTGIHHKRWTVDRAAEYARDNLPISHQRANRLVRGMFFKPARATAAKRGLMILLDLREAARKSLGDQFDLRAFHHVILGVGPLPMPLLQQRVYTWIEAEQQNIDRNNKE